MGMVILAWALIVAGLADIGQWLVEGGGWTNYLFGDNELTKYGWSIFIIVGITILVIRARKSKAMKSAQLDDVDLEEGEAVVHRQFSNSSLITVTNRKVRYHIYMGIDDLRKSINDIPDDEKSQVLFSDLVSAKVVKSSDVSRIALGKMMKNIWGVQLILKSGKIWNIPTTDAELVAKHIVKLQSAAGEMNTATS
ncbi:MAG: hypothetical protein WCG80_19695 [Spirochaetales bacterium]